MKYLGIDYGTQWIGFALGDDETGLALPFKTLKIEYEDKVVTICKEMVSQEFIDVCVVGIPCIGARSIDTTPYLHFIEKLSKSLLVPVTSYDESFSSKQAQGLLGNSRKDNHSLAAMIILQSYLDHQKKIHDNME